MKWHRPTTIEEAQATLALEREHPDQHCSIITMALLDDMFRRIQALEQLTQPESDTP